MEEAPQSKNTIQLDFKLFYIFGGVLIVALIAGLVVSFKTNAFVGKKAAETAEANRPAEFKVTLLSDSNCEECFKLDGFLAAIQKENVKFAEEKTVDWKGGEGKALVEKYKITKVPTIIFSGEINKNVKLKNAW